MERINWFLLFFGWIISALSLGGSLFFSEVMLLPPCKLCWYQRICMYPLVLILFPSLLNFDPKVVVYAIPLALIGWLIALYHNLLYFNLIPNSLSPCMEGVSCTSVQINWFGFVTIPLMSFLAFSLILIIFLILKWMDRNEK